jgi:hypothetical protein
MRVWGWASAVWLAILLCAPAEAQVTPHGFVQAGYAARVTGATLPSGGGDFLAGEERLQLSLSGAIPARAAGFSAKADFFHDAVTGKTGLEIREAYLDVGGGKVGARVGRQIITWGTGDLLFINDVFPKDWTALFTGRPLEYLKVGSDALKLSGQVGAVGLEAVAVPFFEPDRLPSAERFFLFDPFPAVTRRTSEEPRPELGNTELALKVSGSLSGWDLALYAHRGYYRTPIMVPNGTAVLPRLSMRYPRRNVYGASGRGAALGGVVSLEAGYYDSRQDRSGADPLLPNSQALFLAGYQRQLSADFTVGLQYYGERTLRYDRYLSNRPPGFPKQDELRQLLTARLTRLLKYQTWKLSLFGYWSPTDEDFYLIPEVWHSLADGVWVSAGANVFGGRSETSFFGQLDKNDNVYVNLRYEF